MLLKDLIKTGVSELSQSYPENEAGEMVHVYLEHLLGVKRHTHIVEPDYPVSEAAAASALSSFYRMKSGVPLQYVTGKAYFYGREFRVTPDVLIPRPETEILCREVIRHALSYEGPVRILDLCTGSGCIAWTLALEIPGSDVLGVDISRGALGVASSQDFDAELQSSEASVPSFMLTDVLASGDVLQSKGSFDVIVSNPPYVRDSEKEHMRSNVLDHEPHLALFVPDDDPLLFYRAVASWALRLLSPGGFGIVEINEALGRETAEVFSSAGFVSVNILQDLSSKDRFVSFRRNL